MRTSAVELDTSVPVVLIWPSIGVIRSLGRLGVPVFCIDPYGKAPATASRYCRETFVWDLRIADPARSVAFLGSVAEHVGGHPILLAADDCSAIFVAEHARELKQWYRIQHPTPELAEALSNKESMFHLCREHGVPTPAAFFPKTRAAVEAMLDEIEFPIMLKGIDTQLQERRTGKRMVLVRGKSELLAAYDELEHPDEPNLMLQEYVPGGTDAIWMFNGYFDSDGRCLVGYTGRKLRQWPDGTGATSLGICVANREVESSVTRLMGALGYRGPLDLGLRYDARDGRYKLLDVNPRIGATFRLFVGDNDMDVVRALHLDLTGRPVEAGAYRNGRKWIDEFADLSSSYLHIRRHQLGLRSWLRSFRGIEERQWLAREDPAPFAALAVQLARDATRRSRAPVETGVGPPRAAPAGDLPGLQAGPERMADATVSRPAATA
jgi:D-aspartate ligase